MPRLVISTVGTSILTNRLKLFYEEDWLERLQYTANYPESEIPKDVDSIIQKLTQRAKEKLYRDPEGKVINPDGDKVKQASAELNGIYGLYQDNLSQGQKDIHWLITTDTEQGQVSAEIVRDFLRDNQLDAHIYTPHELSTASTEKFANGIDELLKWIDDTIPGFNGYHICFNLVGGFKALQGYATTIGMFYANEMIYVFEGSSDVIKIPRLPIQIDHSVIKPVEFALMAAGGWVKVSELDGVPDSLILKVGDEATLTNWGRLTWNNCKRDFLSGDLLRFPRLHYEPSFEKDYVRIKVDQKKLELQETLAKVSCLLVKHHGDTAALKVDGGVLYEVYTNKNGIAHFRVTQGIRVSCVAADGVLKLRRYGKEPDVNKNP